MEALCGGFDGGGGGGRGGGGRVAVAVAGPEFRSQVVDTIMKKLALIQRGGQHARFQFAANLEATIFSHTRSMDEYMRTISFNIANIRRPQPASVCQQQIQMGQQMLPAHPVQAVHGVNFWVPAMPQAASNIAVPTRIPSHLQGMINARHSESIPMPEQIMNSQPGAIAPSAPIRERRNQPGQRVVQSEGTRCQAQCNPASMMLQNAATVEPDAHQQNHLLRQNANGVSMQPMVPFQIQQQQQQEQMLMWLHNQQRLGANQHNLHMQGHQMHGAQQSNAAGMQIGGHPGVQNNQEQIKMFPSQPMTLPPPQIAVDQQSNSTCLNPETPITTESVVDWKEEIYQKMIRSHQSQEYHEPPQTPSLTGEAFPSAPSHDDQSDEQEKPAEASSSQSSQNNSDDTTTPSIFQLSYTNDDNSVDQVEEDDIFQQLLHDDRAEAAEAKTRPFDCLTDAATALPQEELRSAAYLMLSPKRSYDDPMTWVDGQLPPPSAMEPESSPRSSPKRQKTDNSDSSGDSTLLREIKAINDKLIDTLITVTGDGGDGGTTSIMFNYTPVALAPDMKQLITSYAGTSLVKSVKLSVCPGSSPVLLDDEPPQRGMHGEIAGMVDVAFQRALGGLPEPMTIEQMARAWDASVRGAVMEFARQRGGGTFSSAYGRWESCTGE